MIRYTKQTNELAFKLSREIKKAAASGRQNDDIDSMTIVDLVLSYCSLRAASESECEFLLKLEEFQDKLSVSDQVIEFFKNTERVLKNENEFQGNRQRKHNARQRLLKQKNTCKKCNN